jgi:sugar lactone lactonase YvrE
MHTTSHTRKALLMVVVGILVSFGRPPAVVAHDAIAVEVSGGLVVTEGESRVVRIDPVSGALTVVSGCPVLVLPCPEELIGQGPPFEILQGIAVEADGSLIVAGSTSVMRVHPISGDRTVVSDHTTGSGSPFTSLSAITVEPDGRWLVADRGTVVVVIRGRAAVLRVDPTTGDRTIVSGGGTFGHRVGRGPRLSDPTGVAVEANATIVIVEGTLGRQAVVRIDPVSGHRTVVSSDTTGSGPLFSDPQAIAVEDTGSFVVADRQSIIRVDPVSGNRMVVSGCPQPGLSCAPAERIGSGPAFECLFDIAVEAGGSLVVADACTRSSKPHGVVIRVDPTTGARSLVSQPELSSP